MGLNFKLIQRTTKTSTSDVAHSSGYGTVNNRASFGTSDNTTFSQRQQIEHNRKHIQGYKNAQVAQSVNRVPGAIQTREQEMALQAALAQIEASERSYGYGASRKQEFNNNLEKGGLQKYDLRSRQNSSINRAGIATSSAGARQAAAQMRASREARFSAPARPTPKTGGFSR